MLKFKDGNIADIQIYCVAKFGTFTCIIEPTIVQQSAGLYQENVIDNTYHVCGLQLIILHAL